MLVRLWRKGNSYTLLVGMLISSAPVESSLEISQRKGGKGRKAFFVEEAA